MTLAATEPIKTSRGLKLRFQPDDRFIARTVELSGAWEEDVARAIESHLRHGWTFLDLGAHVGYFSLLAAQRCAQVIAVEANREAAALLRENAACNGLENIEVHACAVSDWVGAGTLALHPDYDGNPGASYLKHSGGLGDTDVRRLRDILGERRPQMIKVDIEGLEEAVLADSLDIFLAAEVVIFEVSPGQLARYGSTVSSLLDRFQELGFTVTHTDGERLAREGLEELTSRQYINLMARKVKTATLILCAWRTLTVETAECMLIMRDRGWDYMIGRGDALIQRVRSRFVSNWYRTTDDDVFLMVDDDVVFSPEDAERVVNLAREKRSIAAGAYPVKNGGHLACRLPLGQEIFFGPNSFPRADLEPVEIVYPATGFMAVHRDVIEAMIPTLPLCGDKANVNESMWPFFDTFWVTGEDGNSDYLSEDFAFGERARQLGFKTWLDPGVVLYHMGYFNYNVHNMVGDAHNTIKHHDEVPE